MSICSSALIRLQTFIASNHRQGGPLSITKSVRLPMAAHILKSLEWAGLPKVDFNSNYEYGASEMTFNIKNGRRNGVFQAYIEPIRERSNLIIHKYSRAYKVSFTTILIIARI